MLNVKSSTIYEIECYETYYKIFGKPILKRKVPKLKWKDNFVNKVVTVGLNKLLDATFKTGLTSPAWFVGLKGTGTIANADTMGSHAGWTELAPYSNVNRPDFTPGSISAGSVDNSAAKAVFNINTTATVYGMFLTDDDTVSGTTGILYGGGDFGSPRSVVNTDTLNVTVTLVQTSA